MRPFLLLLIVFVSCNHAVETPPETVTLIDTTGITGYPKSIPVQEPEEKYDYQTEVFAGIKEYPAIKDSGEFIKLLKENCHSFPHHFAEQNESINYFKKLKVYGSENDFYLIEYDFHDGSNAEFPWKTQYLFDTKGKLLKTLDKVHIDVVQIFTREKPFLICMSRTAHGNGGHDILKMQGDSLISVYGRNENEIPQTYASGYGMLKNIPNELPYKINDDNKDGLNDVIFYGKVRYSTYELGNADDKIVPVKFVFLYDKKSGHFVAKESYRKKYEFIYGKDE